MNTLKMGVVEMSIEVRPLSIYCCPQEIKLKERTAKKPITANEVHELSEVGILLPDKCT